MGSLVGAGGDGSAWGLRLGGLAEGRRLFAEGVRCGALCDDHVLLISDWKTSAIQSTSNLFSNCSFFNENLTKWDTSSVTDMSYMFRGLVAFNQPVDTFDTRNVKTFTSMFEGALLFNQPLTSWDTKMGIKCNRMFFDASSFNQPVEFNACCAKNMRNVFGNLTIPETVPPMTDDNRCKTRKKSRCLRHLASYQRPAPVALPFSLRRASPRGRSSRGCTGRAGTLLRRPTTTGALVPPVGTSAATKRGRSGGYECVYTTHQHRCPNEHGTPPTNTAARMNMVHHPPTPLPE